MEPGKSAADWAVQREKNLAEMKRKAEYRRAWQDAATASGMMKEGKVPPPHLRRFWDAEA